MSEKNPLQSTGFHPFGDLIGLTFTELKQGYSKGMINVEPKLMNPHGFLHGGIIYSMADTGMGAALYSLLEEDELCATVEIKITYFKPVKSGIITCETKVVHKGKTMSALESEIYNNDLLVSKAMGTYSIFKIR